MAIVINDFEVLLETPPQTAPAPAPPAAPAGESALTPDDLRRIAEHLAARADRLRAD